jgi:hypothetical protein
VSQLDSFQFDHKRHIEASDLRPEHISDFMRLVKTLRYGSRSQLLIAEFNDVPYRDRLVERIDAVALDVNLSPGQLALSAAHHNDFGDVERDLHEQAQRHQLVHLLGGESWFDEQRWRAFNLRRELIARDVAVRLILWLTLEPVRNLALLAPDLWAWRSGVFSFSSEPQATGVLHPPPPVAAEPRNLPERTRRIAELRAYLTADPLPPHGIRLALLDELATLLESIGELNEALRIRRQEELPVYERLHDIRARAITMGKIADILQARGELDEALRIRREEVLPIFERLGDIR